MLVPHKKQKTSISSTLNENKPVNGPEVKSEPSFPLSFPITSQQISIQQLTNQDSEQVNQLTSENESPPPKTIRNLSCQRCRVRKVRCDGKHPCYSCQKIGADCVRITNDMRKKRPPANYVTSLEKKINSLTQFFENFKKIPSVEEKSKYLDENDIESFLSKEDTNDSFNFKVDSSSKSNHSQDHVADTNIKPFYGPTSVYDTGLAEKKPTSFNKRKSESSINNLNKDPDILHCVKLFFKWQYPDHNMFIFRESFLTDFLDPKPNSQYCSRVLVLSICALGSRMSDSDAIYNRSIHFYNEARSSLLSKLDHPSIPSLQSFLLLAFYDICNGSNSSGWMLSGNAMRMGFDLGFQLNPQVWFLKDQHQSNPLDMAIRSRIYWGSYMADHFISLVLGRPSLLKMSDASIPETNNLPDLEWIDEFRFIGPNEARNKDGFRNSNISDPLKSVINLINISDNILNDIFTKTENDHIDENHNIEDLNLTSRLEKLINYNSQIRSWKKNLPKDLNWDREKLKFMGDNPTLSCVKYYYYILVLCLNRPFVGIKRDFEHNKHSSPSYICNETIEDLLVALERFKNVHGLRRASVFIVYCCILSISVILLTNSSPDLSLQNKERLEFFLDILNGCSRTWKLAEKSYNLIRLKLQNSYDSEVNLNINGKIIKKKEKPPKKITKPRKPSLSKVNKVKSQIQPNINNLTLPDPISDHNFLPSTSNPLTNNPNSNVSTSPLNDPTSLTNQDYNRISNEQASASTGSPGQSIASNGSQVDNKDIAETNTELLFDDNLEFFGGPPVLMTSDLFNEDWGSLFPDYNFNSKN